MDFCRRSPLILRKANASDAYGRSGPFEGPMLQTLGPTRLFTYLDQLGTVVLKVFFQAEKEEVTLIEDIICSYQQHNSL